MADVQMPRLSDSMEEGKILRWLKAPGDSIAPGDILAEVETDKADMELEAEVAGVLEAIQVAEGESAAVGTVIATLADAGGKGAAPPQAKSTASQGRPPATAAKAPAEKAAWMPLARAAAPAAKPPRAMGARVRVAPPAARSADVAQRKAPVSPLAQRVAADRGIDTAALSGSGAGGRVVRADVEAAKRVGKGSPVTVVRDVPSTMGVKPAALPEDEVRRIPMTGMRAAIARRMHESKRDAPHFYLESIVSMDRAVAMRAELKAEGYRLTYHHMVLKAVADALAAKPAMNSRFVGDAVEVLRRVHLGTATAVADGLIVPVIHDANFLSLFDIVARAGELAKKAEDRTFGKDDLSGATFTVSNLGMYGIERFSAVINPPQAGILAVGAVAQRPIVRAGELGVGYNVSLTLSCDHRSVDGAIGAEFLAEVRRRLEEPVSLLVPAAMPEASA
ncbi:MAG: dihydrolipoamide acetyltransferase family protein [Deltaproteobacteria bacterium]